jgi:hypothetical protein
MSSARLPSRGAVPAPAAGPARPRLWPSSITTLPSTLASAGHQRMGSDPVSFLPQQQHAYSLLVGQATVAPDRLARFHAFLLTHLQPLLAGMPAMGRVGTGARAVWNLELAPTGPCYAALSRELSHSGHYAVPWEDAHVLIPVRPTPRPLPAASLRLNLQNVPLSCSCVGLPEALLTLAGYTPIRCPASGSLSPPPAGSSSVLVLQYRLGSHANAAQFLVDVLPPPDDPFLQRLPIFAPVLSVPGQPPLSVFVAHDPLPCPRPSSGLAAAVAAPAESTLAPVSGAGLPHASGASSSAAVVLDPPGGADSPSPVASAPHLDLPRASLGLPAGGAFQDSGPALATDAPSAPTPGGARTPAPVGVAAPGLVFATALPARRGLASESAAGLSPATGDPPSVRPPRPIGRPPLGSLHHYGRFGGPFGGPRLLSLGAPSRAAGAPGTPACRAVAPRSTAVSRPASPIRQASPTPRGGPPAPPSSPAPECPICYQLLSSSPATHTSCAHAFHAACLHTWFRQGRRTCPICRHGPLPEAAPHQPPQRLGLIPSLLPDDAPPPDPLLVPLPDPGPVPELADAVPQQLALGPPPLPEGRSQPARALPGPALPPAASPRSGLAADISSPAEASRWWRQGPAPAGTSPAVPPTPGTPPAASRAPRRVPKRPRGRLAPCPPLSTPRPQRTRRPPAAFWLGQLAPMVCDPDSSPTGSPPRARRCPSAAAARGGPAGGSP